MLLIVIYLSVIFDKKSISLVNAILQIFNLHNPRLEWDIILFPQFDIVFFILFYNKKEIFSKKRKSICHELYDEDGKSMDVQ